MTMVTTTVEGTITTTADTRPTRSGRRPSGRRPGSRTPVQPATQMRVMFDEHGQPVLDPFPSLVRWMVRAYGE